MPDDNIVQLHELTDMDIPVERVLEAAKECSVVFVLGRDADDKPYFASSTGDTRELMFLYRQWEHTLFADEVPFES